MTDEPEFWMRGPVEGIPPLLQPVAHALLQMQRETHEILQGFNDENLWVRPKGVASVGFHLKHMAGVIDRMFTYAEEKPLSEEQFARLKAESSEEENGKVSDLLDALNLTIDEAIRRLGATDENRLTETRFLGRKKIPVTLTGLLFHSAEHGMRHLGQMKVTARMVKPDHFLNKNGLTLQNQKNRNA